MPFTEFCCRSGGSNLNAGTRTGNSTVPGTAADLTYASGSWVAATGVFTVASGDPVADGVAVGDFASVYANGSTVTGFVGRVTARNTTTITVSLTAKAGTAPTDGTGNRTLKIGGAWAGPNNTDTFPAAFVTSTLTNASGDRPRVNFRNDAVFAVSSGVTFSQTDNLYQGFTTSYGDGGRATLQGAVGASFVVATTSGNSNTYRDLIFDASLFTSGTSDCVNASGGSYFHGCVFKGGRNNGLTFGSSGGMCVECEFVDNNRANTASKAGCVSAGGASFLRCVFHDNTGSNTSGLRIGSPGFVSTCIFDTNGGDGLIWLGGSGGAGSYITNCDCYNNTGDGIDLQGTSRSEVYVENCNLIKNGGYGIRGNASATTTTFIHLKNNAFGAGTQANTSGTTTSLGGNSFEEGSINYASNVTPWVDPANGDFRINLATAKGAGRGSFTQTTASYTGAVGYPDIGAAQHQDSGGGGGVRIVNVRGGADQ